MDLSKIILYNLLENKINERVSYTNPHIDSNTKDAQIIVTFDPSIDEFPVYRYCKDIVTRRVQRKNPRLVCTSYDPNIRKFKSGRYGWIFYFSEE